MKKTKIKRRIENAFAAFFADEDLGESKLETFRNEANLRHEREFADPAQKNGTLETILKQVFFFFPGTFILYFSGIFLPMMIIESFTLRNRVISFFEFFSLACILLAAILMTWLGLGDLRKPKHLIIPVSIFSVGTLWIVIAGIFAVVSNYLGGLFFYNYNKSFLIYLFPLALIVPFLAKGWVDRES